MKHSKQQFTVSRHHGERGVVSIFIVIFAAIFMTIITASFITIMITDQQQATSMNLSQSAYDSAMSGVEDAKRALVYCQTAPGGNPGCNEIKNQPPRAANDCTLLQSVGISTFGPGQGGNLEVPIQTSVGDKALDQAYTCVGISTESPNVQTTIGNGQVNLIPLKSDVPFDSVEVSWNTAASLTQAKLPLPGIKQQFSPFSDWTSAAKNYPPVIQATLITVGGSIKQTDFDTKAKPGNSGASTLMLRPSSSVVASPSFSSDARAGTGPSSVDIACTTTGPFSPAGPYTCTATISLFGGAKLGAGQQAFLALQPIYQGADINVALKSGGSTVNFSNVQAVVDSTGRTNDVFRRVSARINLVPLAAGTYPNAALNLGGSLCKNFTVPSTGADLYTSNGALCQ